MAFTVTIAESEQYIPSNVLKPYLALLKKLKIKDDDFYGEDKGTSSKYEVKIAKQPFLKYFPKAKNDKDKQVVSLGRFSVSFVGTGLTSRGKSTSALGGKQVEVLSEAFFCLYVAMDIVGTLSKYNKEEYHKKFSKIKTKSDLQKIASQFRITNYIQQELNDPEFLKYVNLSYIFLVEKGWHERLNAQVKTFQQAHNLSKSYNMLRADVLPKDMDPYEIFNEVSKNIKKEYSFSKSVDKDKWNPADVWFYTSKAQQKLSAIKKEKISTNASSGQLNKLNTAIYELYKSKDLYPVSMKAPSGITARITNVNEDGEIEQVLKFDKVDLTQGNLDVKLRFDIIFQKKKSKKFIKKMTGFLKSKTDTGGFRLELEFPGFGARFGTLGTGNYQFIIYNTDRSGIDSLQKLRKKSNTFTSMPSKFKPGNDEKTWLGASGYQQLSKSTKDGVETYLEGYLQSLYKEINNKPVTIGAPKEKYILNKTIASEIAVAINNISNKIMREVTLENIYNLAVSQGFQTGVSKNQLKARGESVKSIGGRETINTLFESCFHIKVY